MRTIYVMQSGLTYIIDTMNFADEERLILYLRAQGVADKNIMKALEGLVRDRACLIEQDERGDPGTEGVGEEKCSDRHRRKPTLWTDS
jgi:hypothetical protein